MNMKSAIILSVLSLFLLGCSDNHKDTKVVHHKITREVSTHGTTFGQVYYVVRCYAVSHSTIAFDPELLEPETRCKRCAEN